VKKVRKAQEGSDSLVEELDPWPSAVEGAELAKDIKCLLNRYTVLPPGADIGITLWIMGTYCYNAFPIWPKLTATSPEKRCGKTTLLSVVGTLVNRALHTSNITAPALFRVIDAHQPTLLIDEADTFLANNEELRGVINSGHTRSSAYVIRLVGDQYDAKKFSTWAPMVIAMIKHPPGTILDRSVLIELRRKLPGEKVDRLPLDLARDCVVLRQKLVRWGADHLESLKKARPDLPTCGNDRALDNWIPLLAIADTIGWRKQALDAFNLLSVDDDESAGPLLLADIREVFDGRDRLHSSDLVDRLVALEGRPWSEWRRGKPMTTNTLAKLLKSFRVQSRQVWIGEKNRHGYRYIDFQDAWKRYPPSRPPHIDAKTLEPSNDAASRPFQDATKDDGVALRKPPQPLRDKASSVLALQNGGAGGEDCIEGEL